MYSCCISNARLHADFYSSLIAETRIRLVQLSHDYDPRLLECLYLQFRLIESLVKSDEQKAELARLVDVCFTPNGTSECRVYFTTLCLKLGINLIWLLDLYSNKSQRHCEFVNSTLKMGKKVSIQVCVAKVNMHLIDISVVICCDDRFILQLLQHNISWWNRKWHNWFLQSIYLWFHGHTSRSVIDTPITLVHCLSWTSSTDVILFKLIFTIDGKRTICRTVR